MLFAGHCFTLPDGEALAGAGDSPIRKIALGGRTFTSALTRELTSSKHIPRAANGAQREIFS